MSCEEQIDLTKLSNKTIMLLWLLDYDISYNPLDIFITMKYYDIPFFLFFWKYVSRSKLSNVSFDKIYSDLVELNIIDIKNLDDDCKVLLEIIKIVDKHNGLIPSSKIKLKLINQLDTIVQYITDETLMEKIHKGQPIPDPENGRPYINWKQCKYFGCDKYFNTADNLIKHLEHFSCYTERFHWHHESIVQEHNLTPEKVKKYNMTNCPSILCSKYKFETSEDLIKHFTELGIEPFWKKGMVIIPSNPFTSFNPTEIRIDNIFIAEECVVCLSEKPNIISMPCMHKIYCIDCWYIGKFNKCAICTSKIDRAIPSA